MVACLRPLHAAKQGAPGASSWFPSRSCDAGRPLSVQGGWRRSLAKREAPADRNPGPLTLVLAE
jgi:hypothetical protein